MTRFAIALSLCLAMVQILPVSAESISIDKVLVIVNDEAITSSEYQARHQREVLQQSSNVPPYRGKVDRRILENMIDDRIKAQTAIQRGVVISDAEVDRAIAFIASQNDRDVEQLLADLERDGIPPYQFRASVEEQQLIRSLVDRAVNARVRVSDREIDNYLASHRELVETDEAFEVSHLFVSIEGKSEDDVQRETGNLVRIRNAMLAGRSFEQSVEEFSDDPLKQRGGYLGWRKQNQLPEIFLMALRQTDPGGVTEVIQSNNGLHLLKLHDRQGGGQVAQQFLVRHILVRTGEDLNDEEAREKTVQLRQEIEAGEDFGKLARIHSMDFKSRQEGGNLGWVNPAELGPSIAEILVNQPLGQLSQPVQTPAGYHLFEVLDRRDVDVRMENARNAAREAIYLRKAAELYDNWHGSIRDSTYIEYVNVE